MTVEGTVNNGRRGRLQLDALRCPAGVRDLADGNIQIAFFGKKPLNLPINCTIDDVAYQVVDAWKSGTTRDMAVMLAVPVEAA